eukprot:jgi/Botrbrau1/15475/Bobra.43_2s0095.2
MGLGKRKGVAAELEPRRRRFSNEPGSDVHKDTEEESDVTSSESYESTEDEADDDSSSSSSDDNPDSAGDEQELGTDANDEVVQTDFNFETPKEQQFHGLRSLLQNYLDGHEFDVSGLVDMILKQTEVGTVITGQEWSYCYAVLSMLNTSRHQASAALVEIRKFLQKHSPNDSIKSKLEKAWKGQHTGLVVSERVFNCPAQVAPPLMQLLQEELEAAASDSSIPKADRRTFKIQEFLMLSRVFQDKTPSEVRPYSYLP